MSIFAKKGDPEPGSRGDGGLTARGGGHPFGITEAIQLLRSLPNDQNAELIVRVMRTTLESLNVHLSDIIDDANRKQQLTEERIGAVRGQVGDLEKQLATLRREIETLEAELKETSDVRERLQMADKAGGGTSGSPGQHGPPPVPRAVRSG
jgi:uncharacterized small protein (DUF1192 family)